MTDNFDDIGDMMIRAMDGDAKAYRKALGALQIPVRKYAFRQMARYNLHDQAEDAVQETLMAVHLKLHTWQTDKPIMAWVYGIARHKVIDILRRNKIMNVSFDDAIFASDEVNIDEAKITEARMDLEDLLASLDPPQGDIIRALKVEGASVKDLAAKYGFSESKVKVIVHRGIKKLNAAVQEQERKAS